jgi:hypothetical protein
MNQPGGYWTSAEVASYYRVTEDTLRYWRYGGKGPLAVRAGKELLYPAGEITRYDEELLAEARDRAIARNPSRAALQVLPGQEDATVLPITRTRGKRRSA